MRKTISIALAILLLIGAFLLAKFFIDNKQKPKPKVDKIVKTVFTQTVKNTTTPIIITTNGSLVAKNKIELYTEVQGVLAVGSKEFRAGSKFYKGETLLKINSDEFYANLQAQKSSFYNAVTAIMPDIRLDFPNEYNKWETYLNNFTIHKSLQKLPETTTEKEKFFIIGRGIETAYYNVKNLEVKLGKYNLRAPFTGIVTESMVNPGTLVRAGQKLGEFIDPSVFEITVSVKSQFQDLLEIGKNVELFNIQKTKKWVGKVIRINGKVDTSTQTIQTIIQVSGDSLKEGQYLEVSLSAKPEENTYEVSRSLLVDMDKLYIVKDSILDIVTIQPFFENKESVIVKGLIDGTQLLAKPVPGAHKGMLVKLYNNNKTE